MEIKITYIFKRQDGIIGYSCGVEPQYVEIFEERQVLYPSEYMLLKRIADDKTFSCVWLKDGDVQENYIEEFENA